MSCVKIPVTVTVREEVVSTFALIDSGAAGNFMSYEFAQQHHLTLFPCDSHLTVEVLDGCPLGEGRINHISEEVFLHVGLLHKESIKFYLIQAPRNPIILGLPWLCHHNPHISWKDEQILQWDASCSIHCLTQVKPLTVQSIASHEKSLEVSDLPHEYYELAEAFSKTKASQLPPHRPSDCAIELIPGSTPPKGRIFPLSQPAHQSRSQATNSISALC